MLHEVVRWSHIGVGIIAFASLWTAGFSRKGGKLHRGAGVIFVWTMVVVLMTAVVLTWTTFARGQWEGAVVLFYLLTITATALWMGRRALNFKGDARGYARGLYLLPLGILNLVGACGVVGVGLLAGQTFIVGISVIGFLMGFGVIAMWRKPPDHPRFWLKEHIGGMIGAGIAAHVAFASVGMRQLFPELDAGVVSTFPMVVPVVVGLVAAGLAERRYVQRGAPLPGRSGGET